MNLNSNLIIPKIISSCQRARHKEESDGVKKGNNLYSSHFLVARYLIMTAFISEPSKTKRKPLLL